MTIQYQPGSLVRARGREWVVLPEQREDVLRLRPLGGSDEDSTLIYLPLEKRQPEPATFLPPDPTKGGSQAAGLLLRDSLRLKLRAGAGPFRSFGNLAVEPRGYQLVPLLMAMKQDTIRLLIADDVGIGKTIEAALIARELLDRGEILSFAVLCPPHLCEQWQSELLTKFNIQSEVVRTGTASRLERGLPAGKSIFDVYPVTIISLDYIKSDKRRDEFQRACPEFVIVEEAHSCVNVGTGSRHKRFQLLRGLADNPDRHMVFLTATPHSGNDEAFYNMLGLLRPDFKTLKDLVGNPRDRLREQLAEYFVQRRRPDIAEWKDNTVFPDRQTKEQTYSLTGDWGKLFAEVLAYARQMVEKSEGLGLLQQRMNWWAALALLRCISSSPAAASVALRTRLKAVTGETEQQQTAELDEISASIVLDGDGEDIFSMDETVPGAISELTANNQEDYNLLVELAHKADELRGASKDPKLASLVDQLKDLVKEGFYPVVFCRYIATAHYVAEHLKAVFTGKDMVVMAVTGELTSEERHEKIAETKNLDNRILVATDCLSEGINLQDLFTAVIHYDLSWNPTRHEQREGRVDRFGQRAKVVRAIMLYGDNNPIDGAVLQVILRKAERIRKELGVSVPLPSDTNKIMQAVMEAVLMRKGQTSETNQMAFDFGDVERNVDSDWESAREKATESRTIFAQRRLKPDEVLPEWQKAITALGGVDDVQRFVSAAAQRLNAPLESMKGYFRFPIPYLPVALREQLELSGIKGTVRISFQYPEQSAVEHVHRTHPIVIALSDYVAEKALAEEMPELAARCGAIFTDSVSKRTTIYLLRLRSQLSMKRKTEEKIMLSEECLALAVSGTSDPVVMTEPDALILMSSEPTRNMDVGQKSRLITEAVDAITSLQGDFDSIAETRAKMLLEDHKRVRIASDARGIRYDVRPCLPVDVVGIYVLMPVVAF